MGHLPAKVAILTHFNSFQAGYALAVGWHERARLLDYVGQPFDFLVNDTCGEVLYPHQRNVLARISKKEPFEDRVRFFVNNYMEALEPYDVILTADLIYQGRGNFLAWNAAMREVDKRFREQGKPKFWCHWIHSAWNHHMDTAYPESLRYQAMDNSFLVYMNESEKYGVVKQYQADPQMVRCVYNPKDIRSFREFHPRAWDVCTCLNLADKEAVQIFPFCTTRAQAKGIEPVCAVAGAMKRAGKRVGLILANANANSAEFEVCRLKDRLETLHGLKDHKDFLFTSDLTLKKEPLPRKAVSDLFGISNYFVFGSWREVCPNVLLEAKISGVPLAINSNLPMSKEFGGPDAVYFNSTAKVPGRQDGSSDMDRRPHGLDYWDQFTRNNIIPRMRDLSPVWEFSFDRIWENQLKPLLIEAEDRRRS